MEIGLELFDPNEQGHPIELAYCLRKVIQFASPQGKKPNQGVVPSQKAITSRPKEKRNDSHPVDAVFQTICSIFRL